MSIADWQKQVDQWIKDYGVRYFDIKTNMILLTEEIGELSRHIARHYGEQSYKNQEQKEKAQENISDEIGDILFVLTCMANQQNLDLTAILEKNIEKKTRRDQDRHHRNEKLGREIEKTTK